MSATKVSGLREMGAAMRNLGETVTKKIARSMTAAAGQVIRKDAIARAPKRTGLLRANIYSARSRNPSVTSEHFVSVRRKRRVYGDTKLNRRKNRVGKFYTRDGDAFYGRFLELGTVKMAPKPFLQPAFDNSKLRAIDAMKEVGSRRVQEFLQKGKRK